MKEQKTRTLYDIFLELARRTYGDTLDLTALPQKYVPFFNSRARIEVAFENGTVRQGQVGVVIDQRPKFILLPRKNSMTSNWVLTERDRIVRVIS